MTSGSEAQKHVLTNGSNHTFKGRWLVQCTNVIGGVSRIRASCTVARLQVRSLVPRMKVTYFVPTTFLLSIAKKRDLFVYSGIPGDERLITASLSIAFRQGQGAAERGPGGTGGQKTSVSLKKKTFFGLSDSLSRGAD